MTVCKGKTLIVLAIINIALWLALLFQSQIVCTQEHELIQSMRLLKENQFSLMAKLDNHLATGHPTTLPTSKPSEVAEEVKRKTDTINRILVQTEAKLANH